MACPCERVIMERKMAMEKKKRSYTAHVVALPYPSQGHINPMLQFCKRLVSKGLKATLAVTTFVFNSIQPKSSFVQFDTISDGCDETGFIPAGDVQVYLARLQVIGSKTLAELIKRYETSDYPINCIIYDSFLPWALDVAKNFGIAGATFLTQPCAVSYIYYHVHRGLLKLPVTSLPVSIPGLPLLQLQDMPSFIYMYGSYPDFFELVLSQFSNVDKADFVLANTFYKLEVEVVDSMSKVFKFLTIGPTIPTSYLDNQVENEDYNYGLDLYHSDPSAYSNWLSTKPKRSVVYISFGSMADLSKEQMKELAWGLWGTNYYFLWAINDSEEVKLPENFKQEMSRGKKKGLLVGWSSQLEVLSSEAVGCFISHCGWNSTMETLSLGVPMVAMPQKSDQFTNAKFVEDVWKMGFRVKVDDDKGIVGREEIEACVREVMEEGERGKEIKKNAIKWRELARQAVINGGTSDRNIDAFVSQLTSSRS